MRRRRIYLLITDLDWGGAEKNLLALARGLSAGHEVYAGCLIGPGRVADLLRAGGIPVDHFGLDRPAALPGAFARLVQRLREVRPDLLHAFLFHANLAGRIAAPFAGVPRVLGAVRVAERRHWHLWADGITQALVHGETTVGESLRRFTARHARVARRKLAAVPIAIDPADYPSSPPPTAVPCRILGVGRLHAQKRWGDLVEALATLRDRAWIAQIAGGGPEHHALAQHIARRELSDRVVLRGPVDERAVHELYRNSDVVVLSSDWEGMPNALLEAMAHGRPVVATAVGATAELVAHERTGLLVPARNPGRLALALDRLIGDPAARSALGAAGRARAHTEFSEVRMVQRHLDIYRRIWR